MERPAVFDELQQIDAGVLDVGYVEAGPDTANPSCCCTAGPTTSTAMPKSAPALGAEGYRVIVPYLRGYGTTRFLSNDTRAERTAVGARGRRHRADGRARHRVGDRRRLRLGRAHRERRGRALARPLQGDGVGEWLPDRKPRSQQEAVAARGRAPVVVPVLLRDRTRPRRLRANRREFAKLIWHTASPQWNFDDTTFDRSAAAFDNPDHVDDRHRQLSLAARDWPPANRSTTNSNAARAGPDDQLCPPSRSRVTRTARPIPTRAAYATKFSGKYTHQVVSGGVGHNLPQEAPDAFVYAIFQADGFAS